MELVNRICKKRNKEVSNKAGKSIRKKPGKKYVHEVVSNLSRNYAKCSTELGKKLRKKSSG